MPEPHRVARVPDVVVPVHGAIRHRPFAVPGHAVVAVVERTGRVDISAPRSPGPLEDAVEPSPGLVLLLRVHDPLALIDQISQEKHVLRVVREHRAAERAGHVRV